MDKHKKHMDTFLLPCSFTLGLSCIRKLFFPNHAHFRHIACYFFMVLVLINMNDIISAITTFLKNFIVKTETSFHNVEMMPPSFRCDHYIFLTYLKHRHHGLLTEKVRWPYY